VLIIRGSVDPTVLLLPHVCRPAEVEVGQPRWHWNFVVVVSGASGGV